MQEMCKILPDGSIAGELDINTPVKLELSMTGVMTVTS